MLTLSHTNVLVCACTVYFVALYSHVACIIYYYFSLFTWHFSLSTASKRANSRALTTPVLLNTENVRVLLNQIPFSKTTNIYCKYLQHCFKKSKVASLMHFQDALFCKQPKMKEKKEKKNIPAQKAFKHNCKSMSIVHICLSCMNKLLVGRWYTRLHRLHLRCRLKVQSQP